MERIVATRRQGYMHELVMGEHAITVDEPLENGGTDRGPSPQDLLAGSLAACTAATVELYADRKGWDVGPLTVSVEISGTLVRGDASYRVTVSLPQELSEEQRRRVLTIAGKCPVHKAIAGEFPVSVEGVENSVS